MEIDYIGIRNLIKVRLAQIDDDSKEYELANNEYRALEEIKNQIGKILVARKECARGNIYDIPAVGEVHEVAEVHKQ